MPTENMLAEPAYDLNTPHAGRGYIANLLETVIRRHDYRQYISERLAGDFACALAQHFEEIKAREAALQLLLNERDEQVHSLEQRRYAEQQAREAAERQVDELTAQQAESRVITLSGREFSEHELLRTAVRMVTGTSRRGTLRWVAMKDAFCCGSGVAHALCRRYGFDPDETVKP